MCETASFAVVVEGQRVSIAVSKPVAWTAQVVQNTIRFEPEPNPYDVGALLVMRPATTESVNVSQELATLCGRDAVESSTNPIELPWGNVTVPGTLSSFAGSFSDGRAAQFFALYVRRGDLVLLFISGASADVFAPFDFALKDLLLSTHVAPAP